MPIGEFRRWITDRPTRPARPAADRRVLVVDDRRADHTYTEYLLQDFCQVHVATSGDEAVELLQRETFAVVLLDIHMPGMSGLDTIRTIRDQETRTGRTRHLVLGLSSRDLPEDEEAARGAGMDGYLTKPLNATRLDVELKRHGRPPLTTFDRCTSEKAWASGRLAGGAPGAVAADDVAHVGESVGPEQ
jgi:CheY-like chemotaxis protein